MKIIVDILPNDVLSYVVLNCIYTMAARKISANVTKFVTYYF